MSKGKTIAAVTGLVVVAGVVTAIVLSARGSAVTISTAKAERGTLSVTASASGKVEAGQKADVFPPAAGTLASIKVSEDAPVHKGDVIAVMDKAPLQAQLAQAESAYKAAQAQLATARKATPSSADKNAASAGVTAAKAAYDAAAKQYDTLRSIDASAAAIQGAKVAKDQAYAAWRSALAQQAQLSKSGDVAEALAGARAGVTAAGKALALAKSNLAKAELCAPRDGIVVFDSAASALAAASGASASGASGKPTVGSSVSPASAPFTVVDFDALVFDAQVDESDIAGIKPGAKATVTLDALPGKSVATTVERIDKTAVATTTGGTAFSVLMRLDGASDRLLLGMNGSADIEVRSLPDAVTVPIEALVQEGASEYVFVVADGHVRRVAVRTGTLTDTQAQITSGVSAGDEVATSDLSALKDGAAVSVK